MKNGGPAFPANEEHGAFPTSGLTKRELAAFMAMQWILANHNSFPQKQEHFDNIAEDAKQMAAAMLAALAESEER